ncbi:MAG: AAA family ATPase, partial [Mycobacterium sp.]
AVRLGDTRSADGIARLTADVDCVFGTLALQHARALVARDATALDAVSAAFAEIGMGGAAADASRQAEEARAGQLPS